MRRLLAWVAGAAGGLAAYRAATHRGAEVPVVEADPAEELRSKLAEAREAEEPAEPQGPDDRRRAIHEHGRAALDEMRDET